jgi:hypothetical protein
MMGNSASELTAISVNYDQENGFVGHLEPLR